LRTHTGIPLHQSDAAARPPVSLKCIASGAPTPHVTWTLDGFPLPQHDRLVVGQYVGVGGAVVSHVNLTGVRTEDGGAYTCTATNRAGKTTHTARLNVYGECGRCGTFNITHYSSSNLVTASFPSALSSLTPGAAYVRPMSVVTAVAGEQLTVHCPAAGYPLAKITWTREGRTLPVTARQTVHENGTLVVTRVQKTGDPGTYTCTATDKQGRSHSAAATVQVLGEW
ncbi:hypothetical protein Pcinc_038269, partial [Petrolisthes cinctipes]